MRCASYRSSSTAYLALPYGPPMRASAPRLSAAGSGRRWRSTRVSTKHLTPPDVHCGGDEVHAAKHVVGVVEALDEMAESRNPRSDRPTPSRGGRVPPA